MSVNTTIIYVEPKYLNENYEEHVADLIFEKYHNKCDSEFGYINDIEDIKVLDNEVSTDFPGVNVLVQFTLTRFKPAVNDELDATISMIKPDHVMLVIDDILPVIVMTSGLKKFKRVSDTQFKYNNKTYSCYSQIKVRLTAVQHDPNNNAFNCVGEFII